MQALGLELKTSPMGGGSANWVIVHWNILEAGLEARSFTPTPPPPSHEQGKNLIYTG